MVPRLILASGSETRARLLDRAGLTFEVERSRIDEEALKISMLAEGVKPRDVADALAEGKARKVSGKEPGALVIGSDQVLAFDREILSKPATRDECITQLRRLRNRKHTLFSAAVIFENQNPVWRHIGVATLTMRDFGDSYLEDYTERNWSSIRHSVGGYKLEEEGARLFQRVEGDYFTVLGFPLLEVLSYLTLRGTIPG